MPRGRAIGRRSLLWAALFGCGPNVAVLDGETTMGAATTERPTGTEDRPGGVDGEPPSPATTTIPGSDATTRVDGSDATVGTDGDPSTTGDVCAPILLCGNTLYACGNGIDDDGDGRIDLADPDCTSVCDDDEIAFAHGLPHHADGCTADCYFDGNTGQGDDGCFHRLQCDPLQPWPGCGPPSPFCDDLPTRQTQECIAFCEPLVPNGCDCFGCCTVQAADGPRDVYLESTGCTASDGFAQCAECTQVMEQCGNPCDVEACEVCISEVAPAPACAAIACVGGIACASQCDCPLGDACITGCCIPTPG